MTPPNSDQFELQAAADALGVHYQTAYRWVRSGRLPAALVAGRYLVDRDAVTELNAERSTPAPPRPPAPLRLERAADRVHAALTVGDEARVAATVDRLLDDGASVTDVVQQVLAPPLRQIGQAWHDGAITIWVEHRAAAIVERILGAIAPNPRGRRRGTAVVAALAGDHHALATTMAAVALRDDHWHVHHLGADVPADELIAFCQAHDVSVVVLTVTNPEVAESAERAAAELAGGGTPVVVGAPGRTLDDLLAACRSATA